MLVDPVRAFRRDEPPFFDSLSLLLTERWLGLSRGLLRVGEFTARVSPFFEVRHNGDSPAYGNVLDFSGLGRRLADHICWGNARPVGS
jgi:hypothetical protein